MIQHTLPGHPPTGPRRNGHLSRASHTGKRDDDAPPGRLAHLTTAPFISDSAGDRHAAHQPHPHRCPPLTTRRRARVSRCARAR
jgi:hypothetical protein